MYMYIYSFICVYHTQHVHVIQNRVLFVSYMRPSIHSTHDISDNIEFEIFNTYDMHTCK